MFNSFISNYFGFNRQQRNGLLVLVLISFLLFLVRIVYPHFIQPSEIIIENLPLYERKIDSAIKLNEFKKIKNSTYTVRKNNLFVFDPNTVNLEQLIKLGFKEKTAKRFIKYRGRGARFRSKQDLKKVYGVSDKFYNQLEPYILIEQKTESPVTEYEKVPEQKNTARVETRAITKYELNTVDSMQLISINGIGPSFAKRILKYRSMLGGFVSLEQLKEVYGFSEEMYANISPAFSVNPSLITKINPAKDSFKTLNKHPYLTYELTKSIFDWRRKTDINATTFKDIINDEVLYRKLQPYLRFE